MERRERQQNGREDAETRVYRGQNISDAGSKEVYVIVAISTMPADPPRMRGFWTRE